MRSTKNLSPFTDRLKLYIPILTNYGLPQLRFEHLTFLMQGECFHKLEPPKRFKILIHTCSLQCCALLLYANYLLSFSRDVLAVIMFNNPHMKVNHLIHLISNCCVNCLVVAIVTYLTTYFSYSVNNHSCKTQEFLLQMTFFRNV